MPSDWLTRCAAARQGGGAEAGGGVLLSGAQAGRRRHSGSAAGVEKPAPGSERIIAVGASTGGTQALEFLVQRLPPYGPGMVVVQHMPEGFTAIFAGRLNQLAQVEVREARDGDVVSAGTVLIAPGGRHLLVQRRQKRYFVEIKAARRCRGIGLRWTCCSARWRSAPAAAGWA